MEHQWVAVATFPISEVDAERLSKATKDKPLVPPIDLGPVNVQDITAGCYKCERSVSVAWGTKCPGEASP